MMNSFLQFAFLEHILNILLAMRLDSAALSAEAIDEEAEEDADLAAPLAIAVDVQGDGDEAPAEPGSAGASAG